MERMLHERTASDSLDFVGLEEMEKRHIKKALELSRGVVGGPCGAAALLGVPRQTLQYRIKKHGLIVEWQ